MKFKQVIEPESQETHIDIDYFENKVNIYSCKSTVLNRMIAAGYKPKNVETINGEACSAIFEFDFNKFPRVVSKGMFKCD